MKRLGFCLLLVLMLVACGKDEPIQRDTPPATLPGSESLASSGEAATVPTTTVVVTGETNVAAPKSMASGLDSENIALDAAVLGWNDFSVSVMEDNGFVNISESWDGDMKLPAYGSMSFSFVKAGSEDTTDCVMLSLVYQNPYGNPLPLKEVPVSEVWIECGSEQTAQMFTDVVVKGPFDIVPGMTMGDLRIRLGDPIKEKPYTRNGVVYYTEYDWLAGESDIVSLQIGEKMGVVKMMFKRN